MKYYSLDNIFKKKCIWNMVIGQKGNGKSTTISKYALKEAWEKNREFIYLRRWDLETTADKVEHYFELICELGIIKEITGGEFDRLSVYRKTIYFAKVNELGKIERGKKCGYAVPLSGQEHYSSGQYPNVYNFIFEEFISKRQMYLDNECSQLMFFVSTIFRQKENCKIFMIGNTISRLCPYFREWKLVNIPKMEIGQIDVYDYENEDGTHVKVAVENAPLLNHKSNLIFGKSRDSIVSGAWETENKPKLPFKFDKTEVAYAIFFRCELITFKLCLLKHNGEYVLFINEEHNYKERRGVRIIDPYTRDLNPLKTDKLVPLTKGDAYICNLLKLKKYFFSDNLTGSEFEDSLSELY